MRLEARRVALALACLAFAGCRPATAPDDPTPLVVEPAHVDSVEIQVAESAPVQVYARVRGVVGDGCSTLVRPIQQRREHARITLTIQRQRPKGAVCIQIARLFDETLRLEGEFPAGSYELRANELATTFTVR
jgi:hypothetical protein